MRTALDWLYRASGALAAALLAAIAIIVLLQVGANLIDKVIGAFGGTPPGLLVPSYSEFAGFFLAAASFLALAYTLRSGGHIRVSLFVHHMPAKLRRIGEVWCTAVATLLCGYFAWHTAGLTWESWRFNDLSPGIVPVPLWIAQGPLALGVAILTIALTDDLVAIVRGKAPSYEHDDVSGPLKSAADR